MLCSKGKSVQYVYSQFAIKFASNKIAIRGMFYGHTHNVAVYTLSIRMCFQKFAFLHCSYGFVFYFSFFLFFFFSVCMVSVYSDCCLKVSVKFPYSCRSHGIVVLLRFVFKFAFSNVHTDCCLKVSEFTLFTRILLLHFFKVCVFNVHTDCCLIVSVSILFTRIRFLLHFFLSLRFQCSH